MTLSDLIGKERALSAVQRETLRASVDLMIPASPDGRMPAASELDLFADVGNLDEPTLAALASGLDNLEATAQGEHGAAFGELDKAVQGLLMEAYRGRDPAFTRVFVLHTAARYYAHDRVVVALGLEARPPWPEGNQIIDGDWSLLDPVRARPPLYR